VFGRPLKLQVSIEEAGAEQPVSPRKPSTAPANDASGEDDVTRRAMANPEVRRFQEAFPGSKIYKVRNLKE
jgi:hypothetical protein